MAMGVARIIEELAMGRLAHRKQKAPITAIEQSNPTRGKATVTRPATRLLERTIKVKPARAGERLKVLLTAYSRTLTVVAR
jgi:hypothetical protein